MSGDEHDSEAPPASLGLSEMTAYDVALPEGRWTIGHCCMKHWKRLE